LIRRGVTLGRLAWWRGGLARSALRCAAGVGFTAALAACAPPLAPVPERPLSAAGASSAAVRSAPESPASGEAPRTTTRSGPHWRCGWLVRRGVDDVVLIDRDGRWPIARPSGHQAEGERPRFASADWVEREGGGHGCVCLMLRIDRASHLVLEVLVTRPRPLSVCRGDQTLAAEPGPH
jgi:hypothetical protein